MSETKTEIIEKFGGLEMDAKICCVTKAAVCQWEVIPSRHMNALFKAAHAHKVRLTLRDLFGPEKVK
jgi:hypothetical protein